MRHPRYASAFWCLLIFLVFETQQFWSTRLFPSFIIFSLRVSSLSPREMRKDQREIAKERESLLQQWADEGEVWTPFPPCSVPSFALMTHVRVPVFQWKLSKHSKVEPKLTGSPPEPAEWTGSCFLYPGGLICCTTACIISISSA